MPLDIWLTFAAASAVLLFIPGPTMLTVVSYSLAHGRRAYLPLIAAVAMGDITDLAVSLFGLGAVLSASPFWLTAIKWVGGLYLFYLGIRFLRTGITSHDLTAPDEIVSRWRLFTDTYLVTALNPNGIIFFVAFLPQFITNEEAAARHLGILAATFMVMAVFNTAFYTYFAGFARRMLVSPRAQRVLNVTGGILLLGAGIWALLVNRHI
jgi:threonine/homoserine/homoserine lactone efflux protein